MKDKIFTAYRDAGVTYIMNQKTLRRIAIDGALALAESYCSAFNRAERSQQISPRFTSDHLTRYYQYLSGTIEIDDLEFVNFAHMIEPIELSVTKHNANQKGIVYRLKPSGSHSMIYLVVIGRGEARHLVRFFRDCSVLCAYGTPALLYAVPIGKLKKSYLKRVTNEYYNHKSDKV